jgi:hypothetical protein
MHQGCLTDIVWWNAAHARAGWLTDARFTSLLAPCQMRLVLPPDAHMATRTGCTRSASPLGECGLSAPIPVHSLPREPIRRPLVR